MQFDLFEYCNAKLEVITLIRNLHKRKELLGLSKHFDEFSEEICSFYPFQTISNNLVVTS